MSFFPSLSARVDVFASTAAGAQMPRPAMPHTLSACTQELASAKWGKSSDAFVTALTLVAALVKSPVRWLFFVIMSVCMFVLCLLCPCNKPHALPAVPLRLGGRSNEEGL